MASKFAAKSSSLGCVGQYAEKRSAAVDRGVSRQFEDRLVHQLQVQIAAPHVDDERHRWLHGSDVGEVLLGSNADVNAAGRRDLEELRNHVLHPHFVRQQVIGAEEAVGFRKLGDEIPEFCIAQAIGDRRTPGFSRGWRRRRCGYRGRRRSRRRDRSWRLLHAGQRQRNDQPPEKREKEKAASEHH